MSEIVVFVSYTALPGQAEVARQALAKLVATVLSSEPECAGITLLQNASDATRFTLVERWPSREVFLAGRHRVLAPGVPARAPAKHDVHARATVQRGIGMFVEPGAQAALRTRERAAFLREEWPDIALRRRRLGLTLADLAENA
mgnify:CR=1 FL=1